MTVDASESACYPGWDFLRAGWSAAGRTFEARVGFAPAATTDERDALSSAFASMSFAASGRGVAAAVLGHGIAGGEPWTLTAQRTEGRLSLSLEAETLGTGTSFVSPATSKLQPASTVLGQGSDRQLVAFGAIPIDVVRVEATAAGGSVVSAEVFDIPDELDPDSNAFALVAAPGPVELLGYDASGEVVAHGTVDAAEPAPFPGASLQDGRHFGYVRAVDVDAGTIEFDLAYFLSGKEANAAYHAAGGTGPVPNDHFVVNDNPMLRTLDARAGRAPAPARLESLLRDLLRRRPVVVRAGDRAAGGRDRRRPDLPGSELMVDHDRERRGHRDRGAVRALTVPNPPWLRSRRTEPESNVLTRAEGASPGARGGWLVRNSRGTLR